MAATASCDGSSMREPNSAAPFLSASVCTVILLGFKSSTCRIESAKPAASSAGSPAIRSILISSNPALTACSYASTVCRAVCLRPTASSTLSDMVCGLMEMRVAPPSLMTRSFWGSSVSGLPPSTVNSRQRDRSKFRLTASSSRAICALESVVGVPPPM